MGELVRRLDYERRNRQKFHLVNNQRINREYSTQVRAANAMEDRKKELYLKKTEWHTKMFLNRHEYEKRVVEHFMDNLDTKSQSFTEEKYQSLRRAQSANPRLNGDSGWRGPVVEIVPRHYYRDETKTTGVKFKDDCSDSSDSEDSDDSDDDKTEEKNVKNRSDMCIKSAIKPIVRKGSATPQTSSPLSLGLKVHMCRRTSIQLLKRRRVSLAYASGKPHEFDLKCLPARRARRKSAPPKLTAFVPPDTSPSRPMSRRGSRSSLGSVSEVGEPQEINDSSTRSYRILREAFKKQKKEKQDLSKDRFNAIKADHLKNDETLIENTIERFDKIFRDQSLCVY